MLLNRKRINFYARIIAALVALAFIVTFVLSLYAYGQY